MTRQTLAKLSDTSLKVGAGHAAALALLLGFAGQLTDNLNAMLRLTSPMMAFLLGLALAVIAMTACEISKYLSEATIEERTWLPWSIGPLLIFSAISFGRGMFTGLIGYADMTRQLVTG